MKNKRQKIIIINKIFFSSIFSNGRKDITRSKWIINAIKRKQINGKEKHDILRYRWHIVQI